MDCICTIMKYSDQVFYLVTRPNLSYLQQIIAIKLCERKIEKLTHKKPLICGCITANGFETMSTIIGTTTTNYRTHITTAKKQNCYLEYNS